MKRIELKYGTARVDENISNKTIEALNEISKIVYNMKEITIDGVTYYLTPKEEVKQEPELPKTWEELVKIKGHYVKSDSEISDLSTYETNIGNKNIFETKEQAEASIVLAQLSQLLKVYRGDWTPDWNDENQIKYCICFKSDVIKIESMFNYSYFISLPNKELAQEFLDNFYQLILKAKPFL